MYLKKILLALAALSAWGASQAQVSEGDFQALKKLYEATGGAKWTDSRGWDFSAGTESVKSWEPEDKSGWYGIRVFKGRVIGISLSRNNLKGNIPAEICSLDELCWLHLPSNQLSGALPDSIGNLSRLYSLSITNNKLSGALPASFVNIGKNAAAPRKADDGFDEKSRVSIALHRNKFRHIDTALLNMPLLNMDCGFELFVDKKSFKEKPPVCFKKFDEDALVYSKNYVIDRMEDEPVFFPYCLDELPKFDGKTDFLKFRHYMQEYVVFPKKQVNLEQLLSMTFVVGKDGKITIRRISGDTRSNARKVLLESAQYWQPGMLNGKPVSTSYSYTINFTMRDY